MASLLPAKQDGNHGGIEYRCCGKLTEDIAGGVGILLRPGAKHHHHQVLSLDRLVGPGPLECALGVVPSPPLRQHC